MIWKRYIEKKKTQTLALELILDGYRTDRHENISYVLYYYFVANKVVAK